MSSIAVSQSVTETDILDHLFKEYSAAVDAFEHDSHKQKLSNGAQQFIEFAREYLATNRPINMFYADSNVGVVLSDNRRLLVAPAAAVGGFGAKEHFTTAAGINAVPIGGTAVTPSGAVNYATKIAASVDRSAKRGSISFNSRKDSQKVADVLDR